MQQDFGAANALPERSRRFGHWMGSMISRLSTTKKNDYVRQTLSNIERKARKVGFIGVSALIYSTRLLTKPLNRSTAKGVEKAPKIRSSRITCSSTKRQEDEDEVYNMQWYRFIGEATNGHATKPNAARMSATTRSLKVGLPHKLLQSCRGPVGMLVGCVSSPNNEAPRVISLSFPQLAIFVGQINC